MSEKDMEKTMPFAIAARRIKYLGINLTKDVKDLYTEHLQTIIKELEKDTMKWKDISCLWIGRINTVKMVITQKNIEV